MNIGKTYASVVASSLPIESKKEEEKVVVEVKKIEEKKIHQPKFNRYVNELPSCPPSRITRNSYESSNEECRSRCSSSTSTSLSQEDDDEQYLSVGSTVDQTENLKLVKTLESVEGIKNDDKAIIMGFGTQKEKESFHEFLSKIKLDSLKQPNQLNKKQLTPPDVLKPIENEYFSELEELSEPSPTIPVEPLINPIDYSHQINNYNDIIAQSYIPENLKNKFKLIFLVTTFKYGRIDNTNKLFLKMFKCPFNYDIKYCRSKDNYKNTFCMECINNNKDVCDCKIIKPTENNGASCNFVHNDSKEKSLFELFEIDKSIFCTHCVWNENLIFDADHIGHYSGRVHFSGTQLFNFYLLRGDIKYEKEEYSKIREREGRINSLDYLSFMPDFEITNLEFFRQYFKIDKENNNAQMNPLNYNYEYNHSSFNNIPSTVPLLPPPPMNNNYFNPQPLYFNPQYPQLPQLLYLMPYSPNNNFINM